MDVEAIVREQRDDPGARAEVDGQDHDLWMVIRKREIDPVEVWCGPEQHMRNIYDRARLNWSECYLVRVVEGPGDVLRSARSSAPAAPEGAP